MHMPFRVVTENGSEKEISAQSQFSQLKLHRPLVHTCRMRRRQPWPTSSWK